MKVKRVSLKTVVEALEAIAPPELAEEWDSVGLLMEPARARRVSRVLLTIDLTEAVAAEAVRWGAECVVAYHPPIFDPLRRITAEVPLHRALSAIIAARVAVYSPHTALDAVDGGVNDWLAASLGAGTVAPIASPLASGASTPVARLLTLKRAVSLPVFAARTKRQLGLAYVRVARSRHPSAPLRIRRVAVCAGAGASALEGVQADVYFTGEMGHHDILDAVGRGRHVLLCEHTRTERGYLPILKRAMQERLGGISVRLSRADHCPLHLH